MNQPQNTAPNWQTVGGGESVDFLWKPHNTQTHPMEIQGYLKDVVELNGPRGPYLFAILVMPQPTKEDYTVGTACGKVLGDKLEKIDLGSYIRIVYNGKKPSKQGGSYNDYLVQVDPNVPRKYASEKAAPVVAANAPAPYNMEIPITTMSMPVVNTPSQYQGGQQFQQQAAPVAAFPQSPPAQQAPSTQPFNMQQAQQVATPTFNTPPSQQAPPPNAGFPNNSGVPAQTWAPSNDDLPF